MKKLFYILVLAGTTAFAQKNIPANVVQSFKKHFPQAQDAQWEQEKDHFEAEFKIAKSTQSAVFDAKGDLLEVETEIKSDRLPIAARNYIATQYPSATIDEAAEIKDAQGKIAYEAEVKGKDLIFDAEGKFLKIQ